MKKSSSRRMAFARSRAITKSILTCWMLRESTIRLTMSRRNRRPDFSAATPIGAGLIWFPVNFLLIQALRRFHEYYHETFRVECPTGSGRMMNLDEVADEISRRLVSTFQRDAQGRRPVFGANEKFQSDPALA